MRKLFLTASLGLGLALAFATPSFAQPAEPTMNQVYEAASTGHLDQAQKMIEQVLTNHPTSARAHYVQAELYAKEGKVSLARAELGTAERLNPGLTEFNARSVSELKAQLGSNGGTRSLGTQIASVPVRSAPHFPWGTVLILVGVVAVLAMVFRRRPAYNQYPAAGAPGPGGAPGYGPGPGPGYGPGYGAPGGGMGSGIAGGLASGLAVGAGVVAGEELAHHFLDGGRRDGGVIPSAEASEPNPNSDMGGSDFGANDPGSSWDDGGGGFGGGGGGDDWS
jgi:hypothetical protein